MSQSKILRVILKPLPAGSAEKKQRGRPKKSTPTRELAIPGPHSPSPSLSHVVTRKRGRPRKNLESGKAFAGREKEMGRVTPGRKSEAADSASVKKKGPGRPRKSRTVASPCQGTPGTKKARTAEQEESSTVRTWLAEVGGETVRVSAVPVTGNNDQQKGRKEEGRKEEVPSRNDISQVFGLFLHFIGTLLMRFSLQESDEEEEGGTCAECQRLQLKMNCYKEALGHARLVIQ